MNKLWVFGCSHSTRIFKDETHSTWITPYSEILSDKLNRELISKEQPACGNDFILQSFIENISSLKKNDLVIIQLTHFHRANFYCDIQKQKVFGSYHISGSEPDWNNPINSAYFSIFEKLYPQTIINIFELAHQIETILGIKIYIFSIEEWDHTNSFLEKYFNSNQLIKFGNEQFSSLGEYSLNYKLESLQEAGELNDGHMSSYAHKTVAELIYNYIKQYE